MRYLLVQHKNDATALAVRVLPFSNAARISMSPYVIPASAPQRLSRYSQNGCRIKSGMTNGLVQPTFVIPANVTAKDGGNALGLQEQF